VKQIVNFPEESTFENPEGELDRAVQLRAEAEKALSDWQAQQRLSRARNSRTRPRMEFQPGDLVYYWRSQSTSLRSAPGSKKASSWDQLESWPRNTEENQTGPFERAVQSGV
jgi:hypothetical protein